MRLKNKTLNVPADKTEATAMLKSIGEMQRCVVHIQADMNDQLVAIKGEFGAKAKPLNAEIQAKFLGLQAWAESNKSDLLTGKAKTARLDTGKIGWRMPPPSVRITGGIKVALERLKRMNLNRFIRQKDEINKDAILADTDAVKDIKGVNIIQKEEFWIKSFESEIEKAGKV